MPLGTLVGVTTILAIGFSIASIFSSKVSFEILIIDFIAYDLHILVSFLGALTLGSNPVLDVVYGSHHFGSVRSVAF